MARWDYLQTKTEWHTNNILNLFKGGLSTEMT